MNRGTSWNVILLFECHTTLFVLPLVFAFSACATDATTTPTTMATQCQSDINAIATLTQDLKVPQHFLQRDARKKGDEFDANKYLPILTHLSLQPDYTLDYVYFFQGASGEPIVYARPANRPSYQTSSEYEREHGPISDNDKRFIESVHTDDTKEGFLQFIILRTMGNQFYLFWHAGYNDLKLICSPAGMEEALSQVPPIGHPIPDELKPSARQINAEPTVELLDDSVRVRVVGFTKWGGFLRETDVISRKFPHKLLQQKTETIIAYNWGVVY